MADLRSGYVRPPRVFDRHLIAALLLAGAVLFVRGAWIIHAQSTCIDDNYHLARGLMFLRNQMEVLHDERMDDPPLGEAIEAVPAWLNGVQMYNPLHEPNPNLDQVPPASKCFVLPDAIRQETAAWNVLLFLPVLAIVFQWVRSIYSVRSAWLALGMILSEPTLAAHLPLPALDVIGMEGAVLGCWAAWRFIVKPTEGRQLGAIVAMAFSMLLKKTDLILPPAVSIAAIIYWIGLYRRHHDAKDLRRRVGGFIVCAAAVPVVIWFFMRLDVSRVALGSPFNGFTGFSLFLRTHPMPGGIFLKAVYGGIAHARDGHPAFLFGQISTQGWWYYFPVLATYKIPIGNAVMTVIALISLRWIPPRGGELPLLVAAGTWTACLMLGHVDIGFRHFLPAEIFWLMLASRCVMMPRRAVTAIIVIAAAFAFIDMARWLPDDLSYINFPRRAVWLEINDSNLDWGQGRKEIRHWMDSQPADREIRIVYLGPADLNLREELGSRATGFATRHGWFEHGADWQDTFTTQMPRHGLLVISPIIVTNQYEVDNRFEFLQLEQPVELIGHSLLVYDLDKINR